MCCIERVINNNKNIRRHFPFAPASQDCIADIDFYFDFKQVSSSVKFFDDQDNLTF